MNVLILGVCISTKTELCKLQDTQRVEAAARGIAQSCSLSGFYLAFSTCLFCSELPARKSGWGLFLDLLVGLPDPDWTADILPCSSP